MRLRLLLCVFLTAVCSCADSGPSLEGSFALVSIGGEALPQATLATSTDTIFADTITVVWPAGADADGRIDHRLLVRQFDASRELKSFAETIRMDGAAIIFIPPACGGPFTDCFYAERRAALSGDILTVTFTDPGFKPRVYVRF